MTHPIIWAVSDGRAGIERQSVSLARALLAQTRSGSLEKLRLTPSGLQLNLPPNFWPMPLAALPQEQRDLIAAPWPDVWIATGRRSIPYSLRAHKWTKNQAIVVQTQDPRVPLGAFDLVVPPRHDELIGPNVFPILGPPTWWDDNEIAEAAEFFPELSHAQGSKVLVSIGGNSKTHTLTETRAAEIEDIFRALVRDDHRLWITVSRRTPGPMRDRFRQVAGELGARFWESEPKDGPNPYLAFLSLCDAALVTEDSANMLADPAFFGKPIHILKLEGASPRFDRLHQGFIDAGAARWWTGELESWTYAPIREAARAAAEIKRLLDRR